MTPAAQTPMPPQAQQLLEQMHGIIAPDPVGWWPPAPGWWILAILLIAAGVALVMTWRRRQRRNAYKSVALTLLDDLHRCADEDLASETNRLLKRVALVAYPGEQTVINQAFGDAWISWLNQRCGREVFIGNTADALAYGGYRSTPACPREDLLNSTRRWLREHKRAPGSARGLANV